MIKGDWHLAAEHRILATVFNNKGRHPYSTKIRLHAASKAEADKKVADNLKAHHASFLHKISGVYEIKYEKDD